MEREYTIIAVDLFTRVSGIRTESMDLVHLCIKIMKSTREIG
jgi:hypothetical protein